MRRSLLSCRSVVERLGQSRLAQECFRSGNQTNGLNYIARNAFTRRPYGCLRTKHSAAEGDSPMYHAGRCNFHAAGANVSLRPESRQHTRSSQHVWTVPTGDSAMQATDTDRSGDMPETTDVTAPSTTQTFSHKPISGTGVYGRAKSLDGRERGAQWLAELVPDVEEVSRVLGRPPGLCVIHVGDRSDSQLYVSKKEEACKEMRIASTLKHLSETVTQDELHAAIDDACADDAVDGVLIQLPLPPHLNEYDVMERLNPRKDVDGFHPINMGRMLARNAPPRFVPATALGCMQLLKRYEISVIKKHVVVVGDSNIVGTPLSVLLRDAGAGTVTVCHRIAYTNIFEDRSVPTSRRQLRPHADACLPRLPGPYTAAAASAIHPTEETASIEPLQRTGDDQCSTARRTWTPPDAARVSVVQKADTTEVVVEASNRPGLLNALTSVFRELNLDVRHADVQTHQEGRRIHDIFELTDNHGAPIRDARTLRRLSALIRERVGGVIATESGTWDDGHLAALTRTADVLVVAVGFPELVKGDWVKPGAVVLDVGINVVPPTVEVAVELLHKTGVSEAETNSHVPSMSGQQKDETTRTSEGRVVGDVAIKEVARLASAVTPVPGGVGPMTIAALIHNVVLAARYRAGLEQW
eukprot:jgi/Ulvmu1/6212/UM028_0068.1